ncbi:MAG: YegS/Rv2252/BmrU family lipid kinase [Clostridia bacterium]|nr:YegS/Rv2252/BmrU family lipid kinase [Clostridia bacterium]
MRKIRLIYNRSAGQNKSSEIIGDIIGKFNEGGFEVTAFRASKENPCEDFVRETPDDTYALVVAGGDGTINKVVNFMMKYNINVPLGIIPAGTSNDFANHIGIFGNIDMSVDKIIEGNVEEIDVGKVNDTYFINVLSAGMFSSTSYKTDKRLKEILGHISYFLTAAKQPFEQRPFKIRIETEDAVLEESVVVFIIFNGSSVGRIDLFSNNPSIQDGMLDMVILRKGKINETLKILGEFENGEFLSNDNIVYLKDKKFKITMLEGKCDRPDVDGDEGPEFPLNVECIEKRIKMFL